ncbi:MAG: twin transmembrane helix small protein [Hyphomicrobium sp.]|nr:twin transmembrane helix small protein [Hyphomicrobium sp.]
MATHSPEADRLVISDDAARGGVTGHNVRYVLAFGLTGLIAIFAAIAFSSGIGQLERDVTTAFSASPSSTMQGFAPYATIVLVGAIAFGLLLGLWNIVAGQSENGSQSFMRFRVAAQFAIVCVIMAILYVSSA